MRESIGRSAKGRNSVLCPMTSLSFDRNFEAPVGRCETLSARVRRVLCGNPGPFTFKGTSTFIIGHGRVAVIDPGPDDPAHLAALLEAVRGETVTHILITHTHKDHSPLTPKLKAATGATTYGVGPHGAGAADHSVRLDAGADLAFAPDIAVPHGARIAGSGWTLEAVFTPGHAANHMAYALAEEKALFVGDHVMAWSTSVIAPPDGNMRQYLDSLRLLLARDDGIFHPTHGPSVGREPKALVRAYVAHRRMREEAIFRSLENGARAVPQIVDAVYAGLDLKLKPAAALSALAHLEHLIDQGRIGTDRELSVDGEFWPAHAVGSR